MKTILILFACLSLLFAGNSVAMKSMDHSDKAKHESMEGMDHSDKAKHDSMEGMEHGSESMGGTFKHTEMAGDVHAEFQIMDLASMNMEDSAGKTHHVMATFMRNGDKIEKIAGKVKLISPSGKEQLASLKDFGSGIFAANFTIDEPGKWGVVCLFKDDQGKQSVKFWYPHMAM